MNKKEFVQKIKLTNNPYFIKDILTMFVKKEIFLKDIFKNISFLWMKEESKEKLNNIVKKIKNNNNIFIDKDANDIYYKTRSIWCTYCTMWKWATVVLSYKCHRDCFFCYEETPLDPKVVIDPYNKKDMDRIYSILDNAFSNTNNKTLAITWWEPFLFTDKVYEILEYVNKKYPWINTRIYTTWDIMNEEMLTKLKELELDELRYSIKPWEQPNLDLYALSKIYISAVLIEMPVQPGSKDYMIDILTKIDEAWGIDGINLNELTFNNLNPEKYKEAWYKLDLSNDKSVIYHRYYDISKIEIWVYSSKLLCLELIEYFSKRNASFFMHYCDLDTVSVHHYIYKKQHAGSLNIPYTTITNFWLHEIIRIYSSLGEVEIILKDKNEIYRKFWNYIETSINNLYLFENKNILLAIIYKNYDYSYDVDFKLLNI